MNGGPLPSLLNLLLSRDAKNKQAGNEPVENGKGKVLRLHSWLKVGVRLFFLRDSLFQLFVGDLIHFVRGVLQ